MNILNFYHVTEKKVYICVFLRMLVEIDGVMYFYPNYVALSLEPPRDRARTFHQDFQKKRLGKQFLNL